MRFMMMVKAADADYEAGRPPRPEMMEAMGRLMEKQARTGALLEAGGLLPSAAGARVRAAGGKLKVIDGPFAEAKEVIGGYAIMRAASKQEAIELAREFLQVHLDVLGPAYQGEVELRQLADPHAAAGREEAADVR